MNMFDKLVCGCKWVLLICSSVLLVACSNSSGGGVAPNTAGNAGGLVFVTPYLVPTTSLNSTSSYIQVINPTKNIISGVHFRLSGVDGESIGVALSGDGANCSTVLANNGICSLKLNVPAGVSSASLKVEADNGSSTSNKIISHLFKKSSSLSSGATKSGLIGIQVASLTDESGADGVSLYYHPIILSGTTHIIITGIVTSSHTGGFNNITLVDASGQPIPGQSVLSGNLGDGLTNLNQGSSFTLSLTVPAGVISQNFKIQLSELQHGRVTAVQTGSVLYNLTTESARAILAVSPGDLVLTDARENKAIGIENIGNLHATNVTIVPSDDLNVSPLADDSLLGGDQTSFKIGLKNPEAPISGGEAVVISYNAGKYVVNQVVNVKFGFKESANLDLAFSPDDNFAITNGIGVVSRDLTLTNTGNGTESNFVFTQVPPNFSLGVASNTASPCSLSDNTVTNALAPNSSCTLLVTYTNSTLSEGSAAFRINYRYGGSLTGTAQIDATYQVSQSSAILSLVNGYVADFGDIANGGFSHQYESFSIVNTGDLDATNVVESLVNISSAGIFSLDNNGFSNLCAGTVASDAACNIGIQFGPTTIPAIDGLTAVLGVSYLPYPTASSNNIESVSLVGNVISPTETGFTVSVTPQGFVGGDGALSSPLELVTNSSASIDVTYTNSSGGSATLFTTTANNLPDGWTLLTHGCENVTLQSGNSCSDTYQLQSSDVSGPNYFDFDNYVSVSWNDAVGSHVESIRPIISPLCVSVFEPATISISPQELDLVIGGSASVVVDLNSGYSVTNQQISLFNTLPAGVSLSVAPEYPCILSSGASQCVFTFTTDVDIAEPQSILLSFQNSGTASFENDDPNVVMNLIRAWVWLNGDSGSGGQIGNYTSGIGGNGYPGSRHAGNAGLSGVSVYSFGGYGLDGNGNKGALNDLWSFDSSSGFWTWVSGESTVNGGGVYPVVGNIGNIPARYAAASWVSNDDLYVFGGEVAFAGNCCAAGNDLWRYVPNTGNWIFVAGESAANQQGVYPSNLGGVGNPGARSSATTWIDSAANLWLFGGNGYASSATLGGLNDVWEYNTTTNQWIWQGGESSIAVSSVYPANYGGTGYPGSRSNALVTIDISGNAWLFGGNGYDKNGNLGDLNDLWRFNPSDPHGSWTWISGESTINSSSIYPGQVGQVGVIGARQSGVFWSDSNGNLWYFGGYGYATIGANLGYLSDLWQYNVGSNEWVWQGGDTTINATGNYIPLGGNPGARDTAAYWVTSDREMWMFGGASGSTSYYNDLWHY